jgi:hypothetical protein
MISKKQASERFANTKDLFSNKIDYNLNQGIFKITLNITSRLEIAAASELLDTYTTAGGWKIIVNEVDAPKPEIKNFGPVMLSFS